MIFPLQLPHWIVLGLRVVIAAIFLYAGISKAMAPVRFATDIANFHLLPWTASALLAFYLPWLEIASGLALLFRRLSRGAAFIVLILASIFIIGLTSARLRGIDVSCGCFGHATRDLSFTWHLILNFAIITAMLLISRDQVSNVPEAGTLLK